MEKRTLIALALSFIVLGFYPLILQKFYPDYYKQNAAARQKSRIEKTVPAAEIRTGGALALSPENDLPLYTPDLQLVLNKKDAGIREIAFPGFIDSETHTPLKLISLNKMPSALALAVRSSGDFTVVTDYQASEDKGEWIFSSTALDGRIKVQKSFVFKEGYTGGLKLHFENTSESPVEFSYELFVGSGIAPRHTIDSQYIEGNFFAVRDDKKILKHIKAPHPGKEVPFVDRLQWAAIKDRHFSVVLKPPAQEEFQGRVLGLSKRDLSVSVLSPRVKLPPHGSADADFLLYIGPNELEPLTAAGLEDLVNFGKFDMIGKFFVGSLEILHKLLRNYGIAIIVLTAMINLMLFPLTRVSYMSMKRMQLIQPQMNKLREQHKKSPEKLNKEMMELYRKHKVNPFGGCVPMIVQIPIFIALYVALSKSVILINSKLLWIKDLSSPDSVSLPFSLPVLGNSIHVLPLLMVCAMAIQQRFTQIKIEGQDPAMEQQQKMMAVMMPVVFGFIFYQMPSGLVLYWLTNTILMSLYQFKLKKMTLT